MHRLNARGYKVTQATLSRDLKILRTTKVPTETGGYRYMITDPAMLGDLHVHEADDAGARMLPSSAQSLTVSGNIAVLKTRAGYAGGLAYDIDMINTPLILGTIAGADTVFVAIAQGADMKALYEVFAGILPSEVMEESRGYFFE